MITHLFKGTVMQIEKTLINDHLRVSKVSWKFHILAIYNFVIIYPMKFAIFLKSILLFNSFYCLFCFTKKPLRLNNLKTRTAMNAKVLVFVVCVEAITYLLLYNLHDCTFKSWFKTFNSKQKMQKAQKDGKLVF